DVFVSKHQQPLSHGILVTGANGFIGRRLVDRLLDDGHEVRILVRRPPTNHWTDDPRVQVALGDLGDPVAVRRAVDGVHTIYHLGAAMRGGADDFDRGTVAGTQNIVDSALTFDVAKLIYMSSLSVLEAASVRESDRITEDWPLEP